MFRVRVLYKPKNLSPAVTFSDKMHIKAVFVSRAPYMKPEYKHWEVDGP